MPPAVLQLEQHSTAASSASVSREQGLLVAVQQTVSASVAQAVETALVQQVGGVVEHAVRSQMGRTVEDVITRVRRQLTPGLLSLTVRGADLDLDRRSQALPLELEKQLNRPALSFALSSSIASTIAPPLERHLTGSLVKLVVPALEQKLSDAVAGIVGSIHSEMVGVRKEIVQEQSGAVGILEDEVASLRQEVSTLKAMMEQMHALVLRQSSESRSAAPSASPRVPQQPPSLAQHSPLHPHAHQHSHQHQQYQQPHQQRHVSQPFVSAAPPPPAAVVAAASHPRPGPSPALPVAMHALPPIPRVATPPERYEELFTEAMQPQHEPSFVSLQHLVASSPLSRIDAVFPPPPALPKISMAVVLSLAYRLSQVVADRQGPLDDEGKKVLLWLRKAIAACDGKVRPPLSLSFSSPRESCADGPLPLARTATARPARPHPAYPNERRREPRPARARPHGAAGPRRRQRRAPRAAVRARAPDPLRAARRGRGVRAVPALSEGGLLLSSLACVVVAAAICSRARYPSPYMQSVQLALCPDLLSCSRREPARNSLENLLCSLHALTLAAHPPQRRTDALTLPRRRRPWARPRPMARSGGPCTE